MSQERLLKTLNLSERRYYEVHLSIVNNLLPIKMTPKEIEFIAAFMRLKGDIKRDQFGRTARKIVMQELGISSAGMSNYFKFLTDKGFIEENENKTYTILPILIPNEEYQEYGIRLINTGTNEE